MKIVSVIVAAGAGTRFGKKKQFEIIKDDKIVLDYSVEKLSKYGKVVIVGREEDLSFLQKRYDAVVVEGGEERKHSVFNGLKVVKNSEVVIIHDAARPVIAFLNIDKLIKAAREFGAAIFYIPVSDTVKLKKDDFSLATLDRRKLILSQTPQAFVFEKLYYIMKRYINEGYFTDEAALWEKLYGKVKLIEGSKKNIKITTKEDLEIVRCLLE